MLISKPGDYGRDKEGYFRRSRKSYSKTFDSSEERLHRMLIEANSRAKEKDIKFSITVKDVKWNDVCPVLGIDITIERAKGRGGDAHSPSIDRIDNRKGYIPGNVRLISNRANKLKNNMTREECELLLKNWDVV